MTLHTGYPYVLMCMYPYVQVICQNVHILEEGEREKIDLTDVELDVYK
jgi:hypothetical protein